MSFPLSMIMKPKVILPPPTWDIEIQALSSWTMTITNKWSTNVLVNGTPLASWSSRSISVNTNDIVTVSEWTPNVTFRSFNSTNSPFVNWVSSKIITIPPMNKFTIDELWTSTWNYFFFGFNRNWSLTSLPAWSFDTSNITNVWNYFFHSFNNNWFLTSLPAWSFNISSITSALHYFFFYFNYNWALTSLPAWSFNTSNITNVWDSFFNNFNYNWQLTSLPAWSFDTSSITSTWSGFFYGFNNGWSLTSLPAWSFDTSNITSTWTYFFTNFNGNWKITRDVSSWISIKNITWWSITFHYWNWISIQTISISSWNSFNYYTQS